MENKTPTDSEVFNLMRIIVLCHQRMGILGCGPNFHPIAKFSCEENIGLQDT